MEHIKTKDMSLYKTNSFKLLISRNERKRIVKIKIYNSEGDKIMVCKTVPLAVDAFDESRYYDKDEWLRLIEGGLMKYTKAYHNVNLYL